MVHACVDQMGAGPRRLLKGTRRLWMVRARPVPVRYRFGMAMNLRLSDEQTEALRARADAEGRSMQQLALAAIDEYLLRVVDDERTGALAAEGAARYRAVLERLGE